MVCQLRGLEFLNEVVSERASQLDSAFGSGDVCFCPAFGEYLVVVVHASQPAEVVLVVDVHLLVEYFK